ncbi:unnamed protein product [Polarella glacialis]|uniref:TLC domain-containing protein n=1 Tax=Polarella glacialis TaxID=89957 RepID=A0A813FSR7_POLGL|nr:unnamed protein product [Polarella glacialis]CAE8722994.1 unnamed protein product [Polarella glacialis]
MSIGPDLPLAEDVAPATDLDAEQCGRKSRRGHGCCHGRDMIEIMAICGLSCLFLVVVAGVVIEKSGQVNQGPIPVFPTPCQLQQVGVVPSLATSPFELASPQWMFGVVLVGIFVLRKYVFDGLTRSFYSHLPKSKQAKVANYMLEMFGTTVVIAVCSWAGFWDMLFNPSKYTIPDPQQINRMMASLETLYVLFLSTYLMELAFDDEVRLGLALHHWTTIVLATWGMAAIYLAQYNTLTVRAFFAISLYMSTEQNVFVEMLLYHRKVYIPCLYYASAWYYVLSRAAIMVLSMWTWWDMRHAAWTENVQNSWVCYSLWLFIPFANMILNFTQYTTVQSLFGIAARVAQRHGEARESMLEAGHICSSSSSSESE